MVRMGEHDAVAVVAAAAGDGDAAGGGAADCAAVVVVDFAGTRHGMHNAHQEDPWVPC